MKKWKAFVTRGFPGEEAMNRLKEEFDVVQKSGWFAPTREEYLQNLKDADVMLCYSDDIDEVLVEQAPNLKFVVDNWGIDGEKKKMFERHHVKVFEGMPNSYPWIVKGVAEIAWGLILATGRRFREGDELVRHGTWTHSEQSNHELLGEGLVGRKLGILGAGRIGMEVARRAAGFETEVLYTDVNDNAEMNAMGCKRVEKQTLFAESDFIVICVSAFGDKENYHIVGEPEFNLMKKTANLINVTRGWIIDEKAMIRALKAGKFAGAGLEVFEQEPDVDHELKKMYNVMMVPHAGGALYRERAKNFEIMVDACIAFKHENEGK